MSPSYRRTLSAVGAGLFVLFFWLNPTPTTSDPVLHPRLFAISPWVILAFWAAIVTTFFQTGPSHWVTLIIAAVPFESSASFGFLPSLSPIDYFCAAAAPALLFHYRHRLGEKIASAFGSWLPLAAFSTFMLWGCLDAFVLHGTLRPILRWGEFFFIFVLASSAVSEESNEFVWKLGTIVAFEGILLAVVGILQALRFGGDYKQVVGTFGHHNSMGVFLSLALWPALALAGRLRDLKRYQWQIASTAIGLGLFLSFSRGAWVGVAAAALFAVFRYRGVGVPVPSLPPKVATKVFLIVLVLSAPFFYRHRDHLATMSGRRIYWETAGRAFRVHPLMGLGPGTFQTRIKPFLDVDGAYVYREDVNAKHRFDYWQHLHNLYLQILVEDGAVGLLLWLCGAIALMALALKSATPQNPMLLAFFLAALAFWVHNLFDIATVNSFDLVIAAYLGACVGWLPPLADQAP